ncbi:MAG: DUF433 domain-containing protein [Rhodomicrobium sp.]
MLPDQLIVSDPNRLGGTPVFAGTRVPVQTFFEYIEGGETLETFLDHFPDVSRAHAQAVLDLSRSALLAEIAHSRIAA